MRFATIVALDGFVIACSFVLALALRTQGHIPLFMREGLPTSLPTIVVVFLTTFYFIGLYRRAWRYVSIGDLAFLFNAVALGSILSIIALMLTSQMSRIPVSVPIIHWFIALVALGSVRVIRRALRDRNLVQSGIKPDVSLSLNGQLTNDGQNQVQRSALIIGDADWAESLISTLNRFKNKVILPVGLIDHHGNDVNLMVHGVPVLGPLDMLEDIVERLTRQGKRPQCVIVNANDMMLKGPAMVNLVSRAERLGLDVAKAPDPSLIVDHGQQQLNLEFLNFTDLLGRPELELDSSLVANAIFGKRIMVTGAGGTIGSELVRQLAAFGPSEIQLLDHSEFNLYAIDLEMRENYPERKLVSLLCCIRQRDRIMQIFDEHRPEFIFHAAALKHVPLVEGNPCAGVQTNVIGTRNIADAAQRYGVTAMVQVSTDKAVNPVGMMGATKRLGELYCQALDLIGVNSPSAPRFLTVRFGNVLGSSGSLIPLFQRQLARRGPLTVTHPDIERFFMTVHEAVQLTLQSSVHALKGKAERGRIFVLDMGAPIKIVDIARRMIRLAGLEPDLDVKIEFVGLRPGEKLYEELFDDSEFRVPSSLPGIFEAHPNSVPLSVLKSMFHEMERVAAIGDSETVRQLVRAVLEYRDARDQKVVAPFMLANRDTHIPTPAQRKPLIPRLSGVPS
jgi:FlaA1/EpsC-like NDP-sugar epimerase